jgi:hypothetical protein
MSNRHKFKTHDWNHEIIYSNDSIIYENKITIDNDY